MTADVDLVVPFDEAFDALDALEAAGFVSITPIDRESDPEPMYVLRKAGGEVDLLVASAEPESTIVAEATMAEIFGTPAPVATLEHLALMYLYSNQPKHLGDFARVVTSEGFDLAWVERYVADVHPEMLTALRERVRSARHPAPAPPRPPARARKKP